MKQIYASPCVSSITRSIIKSAHISSRAFLSNPARENIRKVAFQNLRNTALLRLSLAHHTYLSRKQTRIKVFYHERSSIPRALSTRRERLPVPDVLSFSRKSERRVTPGKFRVLSRSFVSGVVGSATERDRGSHRGLLANRGTRGGRDWRVETDIFAGVETNARWFGRVEHEKDWWQCHQRVLGFSARIEVNAGVIGAYGDDEMGDFFEAAMKRNKVNTTYMIRKEGRQTGRCLCLVHPKTGQRTMRPAFDENCRLLAKEIPEEAFKGTVVKNVWMRKWVILNAYACYGEDELLERALDTAEMQKANVCFHLSSFELVRKFKDKRISECLRRDCVKIVMGNEDEVTEYGNGDFEKGLELLIASVDIVVATLGERGLVALERNRQSGEIRRIEQRAAYTANEDYRYNWRWGRVDERVHVWHTEREDVGTVLRDRMFNRRRGLYSVWC